MPDLAERRAAEDVYFFLFCSCSKIFGLRCQKAQFCDKPFAFAFSIAHTQTKSKCEGNIAIWPLHYCLSFCIEQDVKYFIWSLFMYSTEYMLAQVEHG